MVQRPSIAIVGAGPGGLTAANVLRRAGWKATIFDADQSAAARDQGRTLDLHPGDGQLALAKAGLLDAILAIARHEDQGNRALDHASAKMLRDVVPEPGTGDRPEIDRAVLRDLLLSPLGADAVRWRRLQGRPGAGPSRCRETSIAAPMVFAGWTSSNAAWAQQQSRTIHVRTSGAGYTASGRVVRMGICRAHRFPCRC